MSVTKFVYQPRPIEMWAKRCELPLRGINSRPLPEHDASNSRTSAIVPIRTEQVGGALQENILTLLVYDTEAVPNILSAVDVSLFESAVYRNIADEAVKYFRKYKKAPAEHISDLLEPYLNSTKRSDVSLYRDALHDMHGVYPGLNRQYVLDRLQDFVDRQVCIQAIIRAAEGGRTGDVHAIKAQLLKDLERVGQDHSGGLLARILSDEDLRKLKLPRVVDAAHPILQFPGITLMTGPFGCGKTFFGLKLAIAIASGQDFFNCEVEKPLSVLFMDFELPTATLKERVKAVRQTFGGKIDTSLLSFWSAADSYPAPKPNLADLAQVPALVEQSAAYDVAIVDNLSASMRGIDGNLAESYEAVQALTMERRHAGKSTFLIQHVGKDKSKGPRGSSRQEDWCDVSLMLDKKINADGNAAVRVTCRKMRNHPENAFEPFEIELGKDDGKFSMKYRPLVEAKSERIAEEYQRLLEDDLIGRGTQKELADKFKVDTSLVSRIASKVARKYRKAGNKD